MWVKFNRFFREILIYIFVAGLLSFLAIRFVITPYKISGDSMTPTLKSGERVFISPNWKKYPRFHRFDIVVLNSRSDFNRLIIKRIIGLPGEILEIHQGYLKINGKRFNPNQVPLSFPKSLALKQIKIPENSYYVLGDNLSYSRDSRHFGWIAAETIQGKAVFRYWPFSRLGGIN